MMKDYMRNGWFFNITKLVYIYIKRPNDEKLYEKWMIL